MNPPENCSPLKDYKFNENLAVDFIVITSVSVIFGILGYILVYFRNKIKA